MKRRYVVLRAARGLHPGGAHSSMVGFRSGAVMAGASAHTKVELAELSSRNVRNGACDLRVESTAPIEPIKPMAVTPTMGFSARGIGDVGARSAAFGGSGVDVADRDTGIVESHEADRNVDLAVGDVTGSGNGDRPGRHGAGTIFGHDVGSASMGVAQSLRRGVIGKDLTDDGGEASESLVHAIDSALERGARSRENQYQIDVSMRATTNNEVTFSVGTVQKEQDGLSVADFSNTPAEVQRSWRQQPVGQITGGLEAPSGTSVAVSRMAGLAAPGWRALPVNASLVSGRLLARARTERSAPGTDTADRGVGMGFAPR